MDESIKSTLAESYNNNAHLREGNNIVSWKENELLRALDYIKLEDNIRFLDLGAGSGIYGEYFSKQGINVTCIDLSFELVSQCVDRGLHARMMDFYDLQFEDNSFEFVWSMNSLLHVPKDSLSKVLEEVHRVLKKDGFFYMGLYGGENFEGIYENDSYEPKRFFSFYTDEALIETVGKLFVVKEFNKIYLEERQMYFQSMILSPL